MGLKRIFIRIMKSDNGTEEIPVAEDIFWGTLAMLTFTLAQIVSGIIHWWGWFLLAAGGICVIFVMEVLRFRVQLLPKSKSARRVSLFIICDCLFLCVMVIIRTLL